MESGDDGMFRVLLFAVRAWAQGIQAHRYLTDGYLLVGTPRERPLSLGPKQLEDGGKYRCERLIVPRSRQGHRVSLPIKPR